MIHKDLLICRSVVEGREIHVARHIVITIDIRHDTLLYRTQQLSVERIDIDTIETRSLAGQHDMLIGKHEVGKDILVDILVDLVLNDLLTDG